MKSEYRIAFTEVYEIFKLMPDSLLNKIPKKFHEFIENERDKEYVANIEEPLEDKELRDETIVLLGLIYRDFLCSEDERKKLQEKDAKELHKVQSEIENQLREKYNTDNLFNRENVNNMDNSINMKETAIAVVKEEKWYQKIFSIIKNIFHRK